MTTSLEQKAHSLFFGATNDDDLSNRLVESSMKWACRTIGTLEIPETQKKIHIGPGSPWSKYLKTLPVRFDHNLKRIETPLLNKQRNLIKAKSRKVLPRGTANPVLPKKPNNYYDIIKNLSLHRKTIDDIFHLEKEIKQHSEKIDRYRKVYMPKSVHEPVVFFNQKQPPPIVPNISPEKVLEYKRVVEDEMKAIVRLRKAIALLNAVRRKSIAKVIELERRNLFSSERKYRENSTKQEMIKLHTTEQHKKDELEAIGKLTDTNLSEMMVERPKFYKNTSTEDMSKQADLENPVFRQLFTSRVRSLLYSLRHGDRSSNFADKLKSNEIDVSTLHTVDHWIERKSSDRVEDVVRPEDSPDGIYKCVECARHKRPFLYKTEYYQMQTRSADEPMTVFVTCKICGHRMKY